MSKQHKYKTYIFLIKQFNEIFYQTKKEIDNFYSQGFSQRLRYERLKKIFLTGASRSLNINLSLHDKELIEKIEIKRREIDQIILNEKETDNEIKLEVDTFYQLMLKFLNNVFKKIIITNIFIKINEAYSYLRLSNNEFNSWVSDAEERFIEGKYEESLNSLINTIKRSAN